MTGRDHLGSWTFLISYSDSIEFVRGSERGCKQTTQLVSGRHLGSWGQYEKNLSEIRGCGGTNG
jgi:hypothetical protein